METILSIRADEEIISYFEAIRKKIGAQRKSDTMRIIIKKYFEILAEEDSMMKVDFKKRLEKLQGKEVN